MASKTKSRKPVEQWGTQTFTRPPQNEPRKPPLQVPSDHSKGRDWYVPRFEYNTPDHKQDLDQGTVTPGASSVPGDQYGHPYKERATQRRTDKIADEDTGEDVGEDTDKEATNYKPRRNQWGKQRRYRGKQKTEYRKRYRRNRNKKKIQQRRRYKRIKRNPKFRQMRKLRRRKLKRNPRRFRRKASVLTAPEIAFTTGQVEHVGYVRNVSPFTGMVTFTLGYSRVYSAPVSAFLAMAIFLTDEDSEAFFQLLDVELGEDSYVDLIPSDVHVCASILGIDVESPQFQEQCEELTGQRFLDDMDGDQLDSVVSELVSKITDEGGSPKRMKDDPSFDPGDGYEIDPSDDELYFGEVDLPDEVREERKLVVRAYGNQIKVEGPSEQDPSFPGYPSQYNPSNRHPKNDDEKPGDSSVNGPNTGPGTSQDDGGSSKVIPWDSDANPGNYQHPWARSRGEMQMSRHAVLAQKVARMYIEARRSDKQAKMRDTGEETFSGGTVYQMKASKDTFIHFTSPDRAKQILASGKLMMKPPYRKSGIDAVAAVSLTYGDFVPTVQTTHSKGPLVGIVFQTSTPPKHGYVEEVLWNRDVSLQNPKIVSLSQGKAMLKNTPFSIEDLDMVVYQ